jgi:hypothetical protein
LFALLQFSTGASLGYLCVIAGFLVIVASVVFVVKGKAVLGDSGAPNKVEWGKISANLTSAVALFVLGAIMIVLPFWRIQAQETQLQLQIAQQPATAVITGAIAGSGSQSVRLLLVVKPDDDQTYSGNIAWTVPLVAQRTSYSVFYVDGDTILGQESFVVQSAGRPGSAPQPVVLPNFELQTENSVASEITPKLEISNAQLKSLGVN